MPDRCQWISDCCMPPVTLFFEYAYLSWLTCPYCITAYSVCVCWVTCLSAKKSCNQSTAPGRTDAYHEIKDFKPDALMG